MVSTLCTHIWSLIISNKLPGWTGVPEEAGVLCVGGVCVVVVGSSDDLRLVASRGQAVVVVRLARGGADGAD